MKQNSERPGTQYLFKVFGPKALNGFENQSPQTLGTWTLGETPRRLFLHPGACLGCTGIPVPVAVPVPVPVSVPVPVPVPIPVPVPVAVSVPVPVAVPVSVPVYRYPYLYPYL